MPLSVVSQLDADQHQAEPRLVELFVAGGEMVSQVLGLQVRENTAGPLLTQEGGDVPAGGGEVLGVVVPQGEGQVEMVALQEQH